MDRPRRAAAQARRRCSTRATTRRSARGTFRVRGEVLEIFPAYAETAYRIDALRRRDRAPPALRPADRRAPRRRPRARRGLAGDALRRQGGDDRARGRGDRRELERALRRARGRGQAARGAPPAPAHPVRHGDAAGDRLLLGHRELLADPRRPPAGRAGRTRLIDYFPDDFVCFVDESHQTVPQIGGMYEGDRSRKQTLVDYGFRLPSALDNRPQTFDEFLVDHAADRVRLGDARASSSAAHSSADRRADRPPDRDRRPGGRGARDHEPDRRPDERGPRRASSATSACWSRR